MKFYVFIGMALLMTRAYGQDSRPGFQAGGAADLLSVRTTHIIPPAPIRSAVTVCVDSKGQPVTDEAALAGCWRGYDYRNVNNPVPQAEGSLFNYQNYSRRVF